MIEITTEYLASQGLSPNFPERFWKKVRKTDGCWIWTGCRKCDGYGRIRASQKHLIYAPRAAWIMTFGPVPTGMFVLHTCDNPPCVRPDHLWIGTKAQNNLDKAVKGRAPGKLSSESILEIRALYRTGHFRQIDLALRFRVSQGCISMILSEQRRYTLHGSAIVAQEVPVNVI